MNQWIITSRILIQIRIETIVHLLKFSQVIWQVPSISGEKLKIEECSYNFPLMKRLWSYTKHTYTRNYGSFQLSDQDQILKRNEIINKIFPFHLSPRKFIYLILELTTWAFARTAWKTFESDVCTTQNYKILKTSAKNVSYLTKMLNWKIFACFN